ncbi:MAG: MBOAT family protein [Methylococcaceae bacterium]|nr:MAG: MBOAT family protein [Methylococcaceae bacterium]
MLFNSYEFIFCYLPVTAALFFLLAQKGAVPACAWLTFASLAFYGWWNPANLPILLGSIAFNYLIGLAIFRWPTHARLALCIGVGVDLSLLAYYKYAVFLANNLNAWLNLGLPVSAVELPLGISFFTFTQIAYLVDARQRKARAANWLHYGLFVTYFPHLIAGPILHHGEMMPQFAKPGTYRLSYRHLALGLTVFVLGLFKKVILADGIAPLVSPVFAAAQGADQLSFADAWGAALGYAFQLYFDFSGYSDMAIGLSYLFGIVLPLNFYSPYRATGIIQFWRRWHMTLSRFLKEYLYIPLGGNRHGVPRRYLNLFLTMLLGGLWHGASWTFVLWGAIHGALLALNHAWRAVRGKRSSGWAARGLSTALTFVLVVLAWVPFRAPDFTTTLKLWWLMFAGDGVHGFAVFSSHAGVPRLIGLALIVFLLPNTQQFVRFRTFRADRDGQGGGGWLRWRPTPAWAAFTALLGVIAVFGLTEVSEFLYFNF